MVPSEAVVVRHGPAPPGSAGHAGASEFGSYASFAPCRLVAETRHFHLGFLRSAGETGLFVATTGGVTQKFDNFHVETGMWTDINNDDFSANAVTLTYDGNGNLRDDGVYGYFYDAWNRLKQVYRSGVTDALVATYAYDGVNRRVSKVVSNCGDENSVGDGGNAITHSYYTPQWQVVETRNGAGALSRQWVYGTQYVDEIVLMDINGDPSRNDDADGRTYGDKRVIGVA